MSLAQEAENRIIYYAERGHEGPFISAIFDLSIARKAHVSKKDVVDIIKARYRGEDADDTHQIINNASKFYASAGLGMISERIKKDALS